MQVMQHITREKEWMDDSQKGILIKEGVYLPEV